MAERQPYRTWYATAPFTREGSPIVGSSGSSVRPVVIMDQETFLRMVDENEGLSTAQFEVTRMVSEKTDG